jgi:GxxExxY protein
MITQITTMTEIKYKDITEKIMGAFFEAYKFLGNAYLPARQGFQEAIYQRALAWELSNAGLSFAREIEQEIFYPSQGTTFTIQLPV